MFGGVADNGDDDHADENFGQSQSFARTFDRADQLFVLNSILTEINLELEARLLVLNRKSKFLDESKKLVRVKD